MQEKTAFVTGATGFLGSYFVTFLLDKGYRIVALVRGPDPFERMCEMVRAVSNGRVEETDLRKRLRVVEGDVRTTGLGLTEGARRALAGEVDEIWHCATSFKFQERYREEISAHNVTGTRHLLDFAGLCNTGKAAPVFYVSTAYAAPVSCGVAREELPPQGARYRNLYEWSKQEAERLVYRFRHECLLPAMILRPSIIIGHSMTGKAARFTGYYDVIRAIYLLTHSLEVNMGGAFDRDLRLRILARPDVFLNLVPIDFVVEAMWHIARVGRYEPFIVNLASTIAPPRLADLFHHACEPLGVTGIELVEEDAFRERPMTGLERLFNRKTQFQAPYLLDGPHIDTVNFRTLVPNEILPDPQVDAQMLYKVNHYYYREVLDHQFQRSRPAPAPLALASTPERNGQVAPDMTLPAQEEKLITVQEKGDRTSKVSVADSGDCALPS